MYSWNTIIEFKIMVSTWDFYACFSTWTRFL